ncbi:hypothetical protein FHR83_007124 [Actinoplanes campanulatus]|uniref:Uncharacterized protein n=1 Tax=Actinoplanes campanulatus TaxID=113559 RepID=A0A7W5AND6_9ACTN|nr:hypothetical protein [Actinoplanes campanulatus]MBB3099418.1 hypothetical protein [Actinoplanes campanulatus]GGN40082.1 hypothetical protein GCM10010109_68680 [Actinoplanes campanulatus]GID42373.1 hypothetical protein Aca09nite_88790 [Actinoplanes campanulatus]
MRGDWSILLGLLAIVAIIGFAIWANYAAPCGLFTFASTADIPARCLSHFS